MELPNIPHKVSYRGVKYPRLEFKTGELLIILPFEQKPDRLLEKHRSWILNKARFIKECLKDTSNKKLVRRSEEEFKSLILSFVTDASEELGKDLNRVYFRTMKTKWASCSSKRNLTINRLMRFLPEPILRYVIFHEIAHLRDKRHNSRFWKRILKRFDNYQELEKDLFIYWFKLAGGLKR
ncbi:MAG: M48 family metallopeptidase [Thermodesulfobacteriota bacterium]|nr:M48 family metallopeptidase [Thermodesulfobacteriota bacterium]